MDNIRNDDLINRDDLEEIHLCETNLYNILKSEEIFIEATSVESSPLIIDTENMTHSSTQDISDLETAMAVHARITVATPEELEAEMAMCAQAHIINDSTLVSASTSAAPAEEPGPSTATEATETADSTEPDGATGPADSTQTADSSQAADSAQAAESTTSTKSRSIVTVAQRLAALETALRINRLTQEKYKRMERLLEIRLRECQRKLDAVGLSSYDSDDEAPTTYYSDDNNDLMN